MEITMINTKNVVRIATYAPSTSRAFYAALVGEK